MDNKELFEKIKSGEISITIEHIRTICDPVLKALGVDQKNIKVHNYEEKVYYNHIVKKLISGYEFEELIKLPSKGLAFYTELLDDTKKIDKIHEGISLNFTHEDHIRLHTEILTSYGHEIGHHTQRNGYQFNIIPRILNFAKTKLNKQLYGSDYSIDNDVIKDIVTEGTANVFQIKFNDEFYKQYNHRFEPDESLDFNVKEKLTPDVPNAVPIIARYLGKDFFKLETILKYKFK